MTIRKQRKHGVSKVARKKSMASKPSRSIFSAQVELFAIAVKMKKSRLSDSFIVNAVRTALELEGASDLMHLWTNETDSKEKNEIIADIQDLIDALNQ